VRQKDGHVLQNGDLEQMSEVKGWACVSEWGSGADERGKKISMCFSVETFCTFQRKIFINMLSICNMSNLIYILCYNMGSLFLEGEGHAEARKSIERVI
jgi:hypothetical protein